MKQGLLGLGLGLAPARSDLIDRGNCVRMQATSSAFPFEILRTFHEREAP